MAKDSRNVILQSLLQGSNNMELIDNTSQEMQVQCKPDFI